MKKFILLLLLLPVFGFSQTGSDQRISSSNTNENFRTLQTALTYLKNRGGITQSITLYLDQNQTLNNNNPIIIDSGIGTSATKTLTIKNGISNQITGSIENGAVIQLNGAKYITLDGVTIYNSSTNAQTLKAAVFLYGNSTNNKFQNLTLQQNINDINAGKISAGIFSGSATGEAGDNANNEVSNVIFKNVKQAVYVNGNSASNANWTVKNCTIGSTDNNSKPIIGIYFNNVANYTVASNTINGVRRASGNDNPKHGAIYVEGNSSNNGTINNNIINDISNATDNFGASGIFITGNSTTVFNNFISNVRANGSGGITQNGFGIFINSGANIKLYFNSVNLTVNQNSGVSAALLINQGSQLDIRNNIFVNAQTGGANRFAVYAINNSASNYTNINYNNYKSSQNMATWGDFNNSSNIKNSIAQWSSVTGKDANSKNLTPNFISATDLHLTADNATNDALDGITIAGYAKDIDDDTRLATPTMGADEYFSCIISGDRTTFGINKWIGYVYDNNADRANPPATPFADANYKGYINIDTDTFDKDLGTNSISGPNVCGTYADFFAVRYKMKKTFPAGTYVFKVGGDDGYRLSVNGNNVIDKFLYQGYGTTDSAPITLSGATELILEYYEDQTHSRVSFEYTSTPCAVLAAPTSIVKSATSACTTGDSVLLTAQGGTPAGTNYQWGIGSIAGTNPIAGENGASITVSPTTTTTYWVRRFSNDACGTYSSIATINVTPTDRNVSGNGQWIGYVYSNYTNIAVTPAVNDANYRGYVTEDAIFDREVANGSPFRGKDTYLCNAPTERYFVRYKMTLNLPAGKYNFTVGGDDGYRLSIDGGAAAINNWGEHGYATNSTSITYNTTATHTFILEYFNGPNLAHVSFNYNKVEGDPTEFGNNVWNVYAYNEENIDINALSASYAGYYVDPALGINSEDRWNNALSPSAAVAVPATGATGWMGGVVRNDNFTVVHKRKGFPCGSYDIVINKWDDAVKVYLDGNLIFSNTSYAANANTLVANGPFKLNADSKMEVRLREGGGAANIKMTLTDRPSIYNGSWSAAPANTNITVNSDLVLNENLNVCSCTVNAGKKLTIAANATLNVDENVTVVNTGSILVKNTGSLVQIKDSATFTGEANSFTMERNTTPMINYDFSYWASPVATQNLKTFSPNTLADKYYSFNGASWVIENPVTTAMTAGRGYIVRAPQGWANTITNGGVSSYNTTQPNGTFEGGVFQGVFTGKANAGTITVPLMGNVGVNNLIGNPYASPISVEEFLNANDGKIDGTFYFWTHKTRVSQTPNSNGIYPYNNQDYAAYNRTGGIATSPLDKKPNGIIASGQGFFVRTIGTGNVVFKNSMRVQGINSNKDFYRTGETTTVENNRFWLSMGNVDGLYSEFLVGYNEEATNSFDVDYDGITTSTGNVMLYTVVDANKLAIQGRQAPFDQSDVIPVGYKAAAAGQYTISINKKDGLFERNQAIYLYDYVTNEHHDLTAGDFTFTSAAGTFDTRFEVRFADRTLGVNNPVASTSDIIVYKNGNQIAAKANNFTIEDMQVYDITGKILFNKQGIDNNEFMTSSLNVANQVVVVKVTLDGGQIITKKVIMN